MRGCYFATNLKIKGAVMVVIV